jgi:hypothetical protein
MSAKKWIVLVGITSAFAGTAVANDQDDWGYRSDGQSQSWEEDDWGDDWGDEWGDEIVQIPEHGHARPRDSVNYLAKVIAYNRTNEWVKIVAGGQVITWIAPMAKRTLSLDANVGRLQAVVGSRIIRSKTIRSGLRQAQAFRIDPPRTGMVKIKNTLRYTVRVKVGGRVIGRISPMSTETFELSTGDQHVELEAINGRGQTRRIGRKHVQVEPFDSTTLVTPSVRKSSRGQHGHHSRSRSRSHSRR